MLVVIDANKFVIPFLCILFHLSFNKYRLDALFVYNLYIYVTQECDNRTPVGIRDVLVTNIYK